jgi:hypothetical protein
MEMARRRVNEALMRDDDGEQYSSLVSQNSVFGFAFNSLSYQQKAKALEFIHSMSLIAGPLKDEDVEESLRVQ